MSDLARTTDMYCRGLGLVVLAAFEDHDGFDGVMLGAAGADYHFEFTRHRRHPVKPSPTVEDLIVFYLPSQSEWQAACASLTDAGYETVEPFNPYWKSRGRTFRDADGYLLVLQREEWSNRKRK